MNDSGWIKLHRRIMECSLWREEPFSKAQAWIDLLLLANHKDNDLVIDGKKVIIRRGSYHTSLLKLSERWRWERRRVWRFFDELEAEKMIIQERSRNGTTITILKYERFQNDGTTNGTVNGTTNSTTDGTTETIENTSENGIPCTTDGTTNSTTNGTTDGTQTRNKEDKNKRNICEYKYSQVVNSVVDLFHEICKSYPRVRAISANREKAINARLKKYTLDDLRTVFEKAEASDFLKGQNNRNWSANFDWLLNDTNIAKVLDGNYDNKERGNRNGRSGNNVEQPEDELERRMRELMDS